MIHKIKLIQDWKLGDLNLLTGSVLISTDDMGGICGRGIAVKIRDEEPAPEPTQEPVTINVREPVVQNREPKVRRSKLV